MKIRYRISNKKWRGVVRRILKGFNLILCHKEISIDFTDSQNIRKINQEYRNKDESTDIISIELPMDNYLGDIYLSKNDVIRKMPKDVDFIDYNKFLIIHGILHLMGHDHDNDEEAARMRVEEIKLMKQINIKNANSLGDVNDA